MEGPRLIDNINSTLRDDLMQIIRPESRVSIAAASFSIYAFQEIKEQLKDIDELRFIFTSPSFTTEKVEKQKREFYIPRLNRERNLFGSEFEIKLRNELSLKAVAKECADWIRRKACFKSNRTNENMMGFINVDETNYMPVTGFTTVELGRDRGNNAYQFIQRTDMDLDDYINLKGRVEARMKVSVLTATGDDNPLSVEKQGDLKYRRDQLERLKEEVVDIEEMNTGVSIMDLGLNEFRLDLLDYIKSAQGKDHSSIGPELRRCESGLSQDDSTIGADAEMKIRTKDWQDIEHTPMGLHALVPVDKDSPPGVIFVLKNRNNEINIDKKNRLHPFYLVYVTMHNAQCTMHNSESSESNVFIDHLSPKDLLDRMRHLCRSRPEPIQKLCRRFNAETRDGRHMGTYSRLLGDAITSLVKTKETSDLFSFLEGDTGSLFGNEVRGLDDFELICFLIIK